MAVLRIAAGENDCTISFDSYSTSIPPVSCVSEQDQEDLRWYFEDYLRFPDEPAAAIAARVEQRMEEIGVELFHAIFRDETLQQVWAGLEEKLSETRIEIACSTAAEAIPWELMKTPGNALPMGVAGPIVCANTGSP